MKVPSGPDFVCIGAQKAGTTWLYDNLVEHPDIWLPPVKEVHFFNLTCPNESLLGVEVDQIPKGLGKLGQLCGQRSVANLRWLMRFYDTHRTIGWYRGLFDEFAGSSVAGDITPGYSTLDDRGVAFAKRVLDPECRVFVILRNPIERIWSGVKMGYRWQGVDLATFDCDRITADALLPENSLRTDYPTIIKRWRAAFGARFQVFLYDDLVESPQDFVHSVQEYIGVPRFANPRMLDRRSNADTKGTPMPSELHASLVKVYSRDIELVEEAVPDIRGRWRSSLK